MSNALRALRRFALALAFAGAVALRSHPAQSAPHVVDWSSVAQRVIPATVNITADKIAASASGMGELESFSGSGFIIDPSGIIVTNKHVIAGTFRITVTLADGRSFRARLVGACSMIDLAVLKIDTARPLPSLSLANSADVRPGEPVLAIGNPLGLGTSLSAGIVSALNRNLESTPFDDYVQTDAAVNHGNSGGPLVNVAGKVVGVNTILLTNIPHEGSKGLGFAISSNVIAMVVRHLRHPTANPVGWIGVHLQDGSGKLVQAFGLQQPGGIVITATDPGSPARTARLQPGDVVLQANGQPLSDARSFMRRLVATPIGTTVKLQVWGAGQTHTVRVAVAPWPNLIEPRQETLADPGASLPVPPPDLGLLLAPITPTARLHYRLGSASGVLVVAVDQQSQAYGQGIGPGDVIENIDGTPVNRPEQALALIQQTTHQGHSVALLVRSGEALRWFALEPGFGGASGAIADSGGSASVSLPTTAGSDNRRDKAAAAFVKANH